MRHEVSILSLAFIFVLCLDADVVRSQQAVELFQVQNGEFIELRALNPNPFPVTVEFTCRVVNLEDSGSGRFMVLLNARNNQLVRRFRVIDSSSSWSIETDTRSTIGNLFAQPDLEYPYRFPFPNGEEFRLSQGYRDGTTHMGRTEYALDFEMPEGTPVVASRSGIIAGMKTDSDLGGPDPGLSNEANYVLILHTDGSISVYAHLQKEGVDVEIGHQVEKGETIGFSGNTGYTLGPHLHFMVGRFDFEGEFYSFPVTYRSGDGIVTEFERGVVYGAF